MITYHEEVPDVETYFELRKAVDWAVFSEEQAKKALDRAVFAIIANDLTIEYIFIFFRFTETTEA